MDDVKNQLANRLKEANNVLVSVSNNPSVDQFSAAIALTLILNKLGKHATTVFSGTIPSLVEFLQPEKVIEKNTDSLRDFIISLDKSKADKLRYKIEDNFVKIFITPYHSSIGESDLIFSQGDFNVDVVVGLGVHKKEELDQAITAHGRILHDAVVTTVNTQVPSNLGTINWSDSNASSVCEMLVSLSDLLAKQGLLDTQISNALLTGIVAETQRFSNRKTTAATMAAGSKLLATGANQQLVANQLTPRPAAPPPPPPSPPQSKPRPAAPPPPPPPKPASSIPKQLKSEEKQNKKKNDYGVLEIEHDEPGDVEIEPEEKVAQVSIDEQGILKTIGEDETSSNETDKQESLASEDVGKDTQNNEVENKPETVPTPPMSLPPPMSPPPPPPEPLQSPMPTYVPPPLVPIPPDSIASTGAPTSTPPPPPPSFSSPPPLPPARAEAEAPSNSELKQVLEPPPTDNMLNSDIDAYGEMESNGSNTTSNSEGSVGPNSNIPFLSHNSSTTPADSTKPGPPNLNDLRGAVDQAISSNSTSVANQPLQGLNAKEVDLSLNPLGAPANNTSSDTPQNPLASPMEPGSSMDPKVISPDETLPPAQPDAGGLPTPPPVPPPLPPNFTAL